MQHSFYIILQICFHIEMCRLSHRTHTLQKSSLREKDAHEWQQSADGVEKLIDIFTNVNDMIFEPFSGGGTTALVARRMNRRCIACEIDKKAYQGSVARVFGQDKAKA